MMTKRVLWAGALAAALLAMLAGCGAGTDYRQQMMQEQREMRIDERANGGLNAPGVETPLPRTEDRFDDM